MLNEKQKMVVLNLVANFRRSLEKSLEEIEEKFPEAFDLEMTKPNGISNVLFQIEHLINNGKFEGDFNNVSKVKETLLNIKYSAKLSDIDAKRTQVSSLDYCFGLLTESFSALEEDHNEAFHALYQVLEKLQK